jgi:hypothetical protein
MICEPLEPLTGRRARIWARVIERVRVEAPPEHCAHLGDCWIWTGPDSGKPGNGRAKGRGHSYPRMAMDGSTVAVHKVTWIIENGPIAPKKTLDHLCRRRLCIRPGHLEMVTPLVNARRRDAAKVATLPLRIAA